MVLKVDSTKEMWYFPLLEPYVHYVPIKEDLSDLADKIEWCKKMMKNAGLFLKMHKFLSKIY